MPPVLRILALLPALASGETITGTVEKIAKDQLFLRCGEKLVTLQVDEKTSVRKLKTYRDMTALSVGDEVRASYYGEGSPVAVTISAKISLLGVIAETGPSRIIVVPDSASDAVPAGRKSVFVFLSRETKFGTSRNQLATGRRINVVGWDAGDGVVDAQAVAVRDAGQPARPPAGK